MPNPNRPSGRAYDEMRPVHAELHYTCHAEGAVLMTCGNTKVLCTASVDPSVPRWLKGKGKGWVTAEYGMLPRATGERIRREAKVGQSGRTQEIQRLIGRALRAAVDLKQLGERQIVVDCDVIQADGGTRTTAITGGYLALALAISGLLKSGELQHSPIIQPIAALSVGMYQGQAVLDLDYAEDSNAETDMNIVMDGQGKFIEVQGTAEEAPYSMDELQQMLGLAQAGIAKLIRVQTKVLDGAI